MSRRCAVSWSGGKDSTLVLDRLRRGVAEPAGEEGPAGSREAKTRPGTPELEVVGLLTMFSPETGTSRSHGLPRGLLERQARAWGLPLHTAQASWADYEAEFKRLVGRLVEAGVEVVAFGDIFLDDHRHWVERVCAEVGAEAVEPLWGESTAALAAEVLERGYEPLVCTVRSDHLPLEWLGRAYDRKLIAEVEERGIDPCGEHGEFHTVVVSGPGMGERLVIDEARRVQGDAHGHWVIEAWHAETRDRRGDRAE